MKKNILKATMVAAIAIVCGTKFLSSQQIENLSDVAFENVEALADATEKPVGLGCILHLPSICETSNKDHYLYRNRKADE